MTTVMTTETAPNNPSPELGAVLAAEAVQSAASAEAAAETAVEKVEENANAISELEIENEQIAEEIERVERWQTELTTQVGNLQMEVAEMKTAISTFPALIESLHQQIMSHLTPPTESSVGPVGTNPIVTATSATPSEGESLPTQIAENVSENLPAPLLRQREWL